MLLLLPGGTIENPLALAAVALGFVVLVLYGFCLGAGWDRPHNSERFERGQTNRMGRID